jgi:hypothetical protein
VARGAAQDRLDVIGENAAHEDDLDVGDALTDLAGCA